MSLLDNMPHEGRHERLKYDTGDLIDDVPDPTTLASNLKSWVQTASMQQVNEYAKRGQRITHRVVFQAGDPGLRVGDRFVVTSGPEYVGEVLKFVAGADRSAGLGVLWGGFFEAENNPRADSFS